MSETITVTFQFLCGQLVRWLPDETDVWMIAQRHYLDGQGEGRIRYGLVRYDPEQPLASITAYESDVRLDARNPVAWPTLQQQEDQAMSKPYAQLRAQMSPQAQAQAWAKAQVLGGTTMTSINAYDISLSLNLEAASCVCDLAYGCPGLCSKCQSLCSLADAVLAYDDRWLMQQNREVRGVLD